MLKDNLGFIYFCDRLGENYRWRGKYLYSMLNFLQNLEKMMYDVGGKYENHETNTLSKSVSIEWNWISWCSDPNRYMKFCNHSFLLPSLS